METVVDRIGLERHELSGLAKAVGSMAVLFSLTNFLVVWGFVLFG
ncbi:MAG: diacylglycerol kinase [Steroidobacteraceae bacterium]